MGNLNKTLYKSIDEVNNELSNNDIIIDKTVLEYMRTKYEDLIIKIFNNYNDIYHLESDSDQCLIFAIYLIYIIKKRPNVNTNDNEQKSLKLIIDSMKNKNIHSVSIYKSLRFKFNRKYLIDELKKVKDFTPLHI